MTSAWSAARWACSAAGGRFRSSSGYFLGAAMLLILPWIQSLHQTRGDSQGALGGVADLYYEDGLMHSTRR